MTLFFLLSGFLITGILWDSLGEPHWWRNFYARRTLRIFPLYFGTLLLVMAAAALVGAFRQAASQIWIPALFLQNMPYLIDQVDHIGSPLSLFHFWSLAVEEQFYLVWPFLLLLQKSQRSARRLCVTVFALSFVFRVLIVKFNPHWQEYVEFLLSRGGELAVGCWLAICYRGPAWSRLERLAPYAAVAGLAGFTVSGIVGGTFELFSPLMVIAGLPSATVLFAALLVLSLRPGLVQQSCQLGLAAMDWRHQLWDLCVPHAVCGAVLVDRKAYLRGAEPYAVCDGRVYCGRDRLGAGSVAFVPLL